MKNLFRKVRRIVPGIAVLSILVGFAVAQENSAVRKINQKGKIVSKIAKGTFVVKVTPLAVEENVGDPLIGRLSLEKQLSGDLVGTSKGQMLGVQTEVKDSAGYVAMERFTGALGGKKGSFALQHLGTMQGGKFDLNVIVVPDSGTGELAGLTGKMNIIIKDGKHLYEFEYSFEKKK
ncbi:MAG: DUF3224 domain-containing protein [Pyrinomonadaceae bacterium]